MRFFSKTRPAVIEFKVLFFNKRHAIQIDENIASLAMSANAIAKNIIKAGKFSVNWMEYFLLTNHWFPFMAFILKNRHRSNDCDVTKTPPPTSREVCNIMTVNQSGIWFQVCGAFLQLTSRSSTHRSCMSRVMLLPGPERRQRCVKYFRRNMRPPIKT